MKTFLLLRLVASAVVFQVLASHGVGQPPPAEARSTVLEREKTRSELLENVARSWEQPGSQPGQQPAGSEKEDGARVRRKLAAIAIPAVNFTNAELRRVVSALNALAEEFDTTGEPPKGVNVILIDPANANPPVTLTLRNLTLNRILDFVTSAIGYQYEIQPDAVVMRPGGEHTALATEVFPVTRATLIRMTGRSGAGVERPSGEAGPASGGREEERSGGGTPALQRFFQRAGVNFEGVPGSSLAYDGSAVIVTQTARNLERIRALLRRYREARQVAIEAKFMEVQEGALDELGVQWDIGRRPVPLIDPATGAALLDAVGAPRVEYRERYRTADPTAGTAVNRTLAGAFRDAQRSSEILVDDKVVGSLAPPTLPGANNLGQGAGDFAAITGTIGEFDVQAIIRALAQKHGSDLLSAPRVTVLSGSEAVITIAQEMRYPQSFGGIQSQVGSGRTADDGASGSAGVAITAGTPQQFTTRNVGVELRVLPTVEEDDHSISLELNPKVTEFEGFIEYGGPSIAISGGRTVTVPPGFFQPIFSVREVSTRVTLWDGATIIMGGLTREEVKKVEDKVPVLGDIPLLGRLFRTKGESSQKRNLLIFVTAKLVNPGGTPQDPGRKTDPAPVEPAAKR